MYKNERKKKSYMIKVEVDFGKGMQRFEWDNFPFMDLKKKIMLVNFLNRKLVFKL